ncbi:hypothetical protein GQ42DRAFT_162593 [Ramicandelaber brevisporus]|nr:hypothetical protein GQ42DRAFT_162593 [Ramicandelaber brevisporus]
MGQLGRMLLLLTFEIHSCLLNVDSFQRRAPGTFRYCYPLLDYTGLPYIGLYWTTGAVDRKVGAGKPQTQVGRGGRRLISQLDDSCVRVYVCVYRQQRKEGPEGKHAHKQTLTSTHAQTRTSRQATTTAQIRPLVLSVGSSSSSAREEASS